jgi:hypothetical protein
MTSTVTNLQRTTLHFGGGLCGKLPELLEHNRYTILLFLKLTCIVFWCKVSFYGPYEMSVMKRYLWYNFCFVNGERAAMSFHEHGLSYYGFKRDCKFFVSYVYPAEELYTHEKANTRLENKHATQLTTAILE